MEMSATSLWSTKLARNPMSPQLLRGIAGRNGSFKSSSTQPRRLLVAFLSHLPSNFSLSDSATQRVTAAHSRAGMRSTARDEEGARVLISGLLRLLELSRCAFPQHMDCGSLLPLSGGQPAGRRVFQDDVSPWHSRVGGSRENCSVTGRLWRQQGCLGKAAAGCRSPCPSSMPDLTAPVAQTAAH